MTLTNAVATLVVHALEGDATHAQRIRILATELAEYRVLVVAAQRARGSSNHLWSSGLMSEHNIGVLRLEVDFGRGAALRAGLGSVETEFVAFIDIEGEVASATIRQAIELLASRPRADAVFGNRFEARSRLEAPRGRMLLTRAYAVFARLLFALPCGDPQSPLKVFRSERVRTLYSNLRLFNRGFDVELAFRAREARMQILETPLIWKTSTPTASIRQRGLSVIFALLWLRALASPLKLLPGLDLLGRRFMIPVKERYRILIFCWRDPYHPEAGGGEVYLQEQARAWARLGHSVTWFAQSFPGCTPDAVIDDISYIRRGRFPWVFLRAPFWYLLRSRRDYDFIVDCMNGIPFCSPMFSTKPKVCLIYHIHSHHFLTELMKPIGAIASIVETKIAPYIYRNTRFLTISDSTRRELQRRKMTSLPITIIHNGVSPLLRPGEKAVQPTILYFGRLKKYKGVRKLILAFRELRTRIPNLSLKIAGGGDDESPLQSFVADLNLQGVEFFGHVEEAKKLRLMQEAWVLGMPSAIEGWGMVVTEANACGTPAVAYDVAGLRDCIVPEETGLLSSDDSAFVANLERILGDAEFRRTISENAHKWAANFSWDTTAQRTLEQIRLAQPWRAIFEGSSTPVPQLRLGGSLQVVTSLLERT